MHLFQAKFLFVLINQPLNITLHIQHHVLHGNAEILCLHASLQKLAKHKVILSAEIEAIKQRRFPGKIFDE